MNEKLLKFAAQMKDVAAAVPETEVEERGGKRFLGYVLGDTSAVIAHPPEYTPLQAVLRQLRILFQGQASPFEVHKVGDAMFANPADAHLPQYQAVRKVWTHLRKTLWLSEPFEVVKLLDVVAAESALHALFDLIMNEYFIDNLDAEALKQFHEYAEYLREGTYEFMGDLGLQGDAVEEFQLKQMEAFNKLMFICEQEVAD